MGNGERILNDINGIYQWGWLSLPCLLSGRGKPAAQRLFIFFIALAFRPATVEIRLLE